MSRDTSLPVRRAVVGLLKNSPAVQVYVPADRVYAPQPPQQPAWPFIRYGTPLQVPLRATGTDGSTIVVAVHVFAKGPGEDAAALIAAVVAEALDGAVLALEVPYPARAHVLHTGTALLPDGDEAGSWHAVVNIEVGVAS